MQRLIIIYFWASIEIGPHTEKKKTKKNDSSWFNGAHFFNFFFWLFKFIYLSFFFLKEVHWWNNFISQLKGSFIYIKSWGEWVKPHFETLFSFFFGKYNFPSLKYIWSSFLLNYPTAMRRCSNKNLLLFFFFQ